MTILNQSQWIQHLRSIVKSSTSSQWELGDALSQGETAYGRRPCYDLAQTATGCHRLSLYRIAGVASYFPKPLRFENLSWSVYVLLRPFPLSFLEKFLPSVAESALSAKLIREKAIAEYGSDPQSWRKQKKYRTVQISTSLCDKIVEKSGTAKVTALVTEILESWLIGEKCERQPTSSNKTREWNQKVKDAGNEPVEAEKAPVGTSRAAGNDVQSAQPHPETSAQPRPSYEDRRKQNGSTGFKKKEKKPRELRLQWVPCGRQVDAGNGPAMVRAKSQRPDCFRTLEDAQAAEEKYFQEKGYHNEVVYCVVPCGAYHVKHIYSSEVPQKKSAQAVASSKAEESAAVFSHTF